MNRDLLYSKIPIDGKRITSSQLCLMLNCRGADIREAVNKLRQEGKPICSDGNGYYIAQTVRDIENTIFSLNSRAQKILEATSGLIRAKRQYECEAGIENIMNLCEEKEYGA